MRRAQRRFHAMIWPLLVIVMVATIAAALIVREPVTAPASQSEAR